MSRIEQVALCRGEGHGYVLLTSRDATLEPYARARMSDGRFLPCKLVPDGCLEPLPVASERKWVLTFPLVDDDVDLSVYARGEDGAALLDIPFKTMQSKMSSRLLTKRRPEVAAYMRGIERRRSGVDSPVVVSGAWRMPDDTVVWRVHVRFVQACVGATPRMVACDMGAHVLSDECIVLEDQVVPSSQRGAEPVREVTFSVRLPGSVGCFYFATSLGGRDANGDFKVMYPKYLDEYWRDFGRYPSGAADAWCYEGWYMQERCAPETAAARRGKANDGPRISVVVATEAGPSQETVLSVLNQTYANWELLICSGGDSAGDVAGDMAGLARDERVKVVRCAGCSSPAELEEAGADGATGSYVAFLDDGDLLEPDALEAFASAFGGDGELEFAYCDEDMIEAGHLCRPAIKPAPDLEKLRAYDYVGHLQVMSVSLLRKMGPVPEGLSAARTHHRALRALELSTHVGQVTRILYHRQSRACDERCHVAGKSAVEGHLARMGADAAVEDGPTLGTYRLRYALPEPAPMVSVVIPNKDHLDLLRPCLDSILEKTTYPNYEVVVVENNSCDAETFAYYDDLASHGGRVRVTTWRPECDGEFNYSAIVNHGASEAAGDLLLFLNNDTDVIAPNWIEEMVGVLAQRPEVAVVGAKLVFPDGLTQHAGMAFNPSGYFMHLGETTPADLLDHDYNVALPHESTMVTGACQMVRRSVFEELGGYDEDLAVAFNDGDFCLRARDAGYLVAYTPYAELHHKEFSSRGREATDVRHQERFLREYARVALRHGKRFVAGDPTLNPNFSQWDAQFRLR